MLSQLQQQGSSEQIHNRSPPNHGSGSSTRPRANNSWATAAPLPSHQVQGSAHGAGLAGTESQIQEQASSHLDLVPTLMKGMLGYAPPRDYSIGRSLFDASPRNWLLAGIGERFRHLSGQHPSPSSTSRISSC